MGQACPDPLLLVEIGGGPALSANLKLRDLKFESRASFTVLSKRHYANKARRKGFARISLRCDLHRSPGPAAMGLLPLI